MSDKKIIAVLGSTGSQGGGLVRAILDDPDGQFAVRAITRNAGSDKAKEYAARGAEVVEADLDDEASIAAAFAGAYGAYIVTNFWDALPESETRNRSQREKDQARNAARAAKTAGLKHVVWSTLEDTRPHFEHLGSELPDLEDGYKVPHFDVKGEQNAYFMQLGIPTTFLETTFYYESFLAGQGPRRAEDGSLILALPLADTALSMVASEDIGRTAYGIFKAGPRFIGRTVGLAGAHATGAELAELFGRVLGEKVTYVPVTFDQMRAAEWDLAMEVGNMFQFYSEAAETFVGNRDLNLVREINPQLKPLEQWANEHRDQLKA
ncbi:NmrA/HSCARG family protein [Actinoplanes solisilvae]|uniref:NmrA/HSCARG family protein n=1 Tax=Actinoplanes solisilvae TaxID=2486853 RepID=UPI000FD8BE0F|nr:NmrA/HSCARG family protein [Actinoplanes solisilvae]